jgi:CO/xanthine dehydrogenase Mo-binding subunit
MDQALTLADWRASRPARPKSQQHGKLRGLGIATFLEWTGGNVFRARDGLVQADGVIEVFSAVNQMGQGIATTLAQLVVDVFGVPIDKVRVVLGDTDRGDGFGSAGSRSLFTGGSAAAHRRREAPRQARDAGGARAGSQHRRTLQYTAGASACAAPTCRSACSSSPASSRSAHLPREHQRRGRPELAQRLPHLRGRDRPADRRGAAWWPTAASTTSAGWSTP